MTFEQWIERWALPPQAVAELRAMCDAELPHEPGNLSEAAVQNNVRLAASQVGSRLWRNNVGAFTDSRGVPIRYGVANDSKKLNKVLKSADLIGIKPVTITPDMVGTVIGQFVSRECKAQGWQFKDNEHERAQMAWATLINSLGGDAKFTTGDY